MPIVGVRVSSYIPIAIAASPSPWSIHVSSPLTLCQANKLSTIKKCLNEVLKYGGPYTPRDLYPYHLALHQIDSLRKDGKFYAEDGSIPEGQAILVAQLSEAHELLEMLKETMSDEEEDDE